MSPRYVYATAAILILSVCHACYCRAALIWDGAYQLCVTLAEQHPYVYKARFHTYFLWWPTVWASHLTSNPKILQAVYGLPFLLAPVAGLLLSWWIVRRHAPNLIIWVIFGVAIGALPGEIFVINDSIFQLHLFWPIFVGMFVPLTAPKRIVLAMLAMFEFAHPLGTVLFLGAAVAAGCMAMGDSTRRRAFISYGAVMLGLCLLAITKIVVSRYIPQWHDDYAEKQFKWDIALAEWRNGVMPWFGGLQWMYAAAALVFLHAMLRRVRFLAPVILVAALVSVVYGATFWLNLVRGPQDVDQGVWWTGAIDYRRWVGPLAVPFFFLTMAEAFLRVGRQRISRAVAVVIMIVLCVAAGFAWVNSFRGLAAACAVLAIAAGFLVRPDVSADKNPVEVPHSPWLAPRGIIGVVLAAIFAAVLGLQYRSWDYETTRLMAQVEKYPSVLVPLLDKDFGWTWCTPCNHWATNNYVALMQGKRPGKMFVNAETERMLRDDPADAEYPVDPSHPPKKLHDPPVHRCYFYPTQHDNDLRAPAGPEGWFDFGPFLDALEKEPPPTRPRRAEKYP